MLGVSCPKAELEKLISRVSRHFFVILIGDFLTFKILC
jgi:hypothetical protein